MGDTSVLYDAAYARTEVGDDPERRLTRDEVETFAKVRMTYRGMNEKLRYQEGSTVYGTGLNGLNVSSPSYLTVPGERTEYIQAEDRTWLRFSYRNQSGVTMNYAPAPFTYRPGSSTKYIWFTGPFSVLATGQTTGARLHLTMDDSVDPEGRVGQNGDFNLPPARSDHDTAVPRRDPGRRPALVDRQDLRRRRQGLARAESHVHLRRHLPDGRRGDVQVDLHRRRHG
ncbi:hypothetical protein ACIGBL_03630 [Streptomyces sp. NPDC085614]|uniref:hypothetical protein n=1 Tax=Streptomyces sp. NPDC085614 TaxID=3365733 RepID=UPI0037D0A556